MGIGLQSLWPEEIANTDVLSPRAILLFQAAELSKKTRGRLRAEVFSRSDEGQSTHTFEIIADQLSYKFRLFRVKHGDERVYPASLYADCFPPDQYEDECVVGATTEAEFVKRVAEVLQSDTARSTIQSLLARINDTTKPKKT